MHVTILFSPFPILHKTCKKAAKDSELQQLYATLLNTILLKKLILSAICGMFLKFESQAQTHVIHLETLLGDGKQI